MKISPEVAEALSSGQPVVALESTVISHGICFNSIPMSLAVFNCLPFSASNRFHFCMLGFLLSGMPYPQNLETAKQLEAIVRVNGAIPATIAILDGVPCIGIHLIILSSVRQLLLDIVHSISTIPLSPSLSF